MLTFALGLKFYGTKNKTAYINDQKYPVRAVKFIEKNLDIENIRLYNGYNYGSYLIYKNIPVFIDSRCDLYTPQFNKKDIFMDAHVISNLLTLYNVKFHEYGITHIIIESGSRLDLMLGADYNYQTLYRDDAFCIYKIKEQTMENVNE